jgi:NAD(P)H-flavin reductase
MVAGGTGITPCMQIAHEILMNDNDMTRISIIFAARVEEDLLLRSTLDNWAVKYSNKFCIHYILSDSSPANWTYSTGFVDSQLFQDYFYKPSNDVSNLMCGSPIMMDKGCKPAFQQLGHTKESMFSF